MSREHEEARLEAGRAALRRFREAQLQPGRGHPDLRGARVQLHARRRPGPRPLGPRRCRADRRGRDRAAGPDARRGTEPSADVVVADARHAWAGAGDDHRLQVVRRARPGEGPAAGARLAPAPDLRDGLRGDDRAGCPTPSRCTSSSPAWSVEVEVDPKRLAKARDEDRHGRGRHAGARLHAQAGLPRVHRTARSATSARRASPAEPRRSCARDRAFARLDGRVRRGASSRTRPRERRAAAGDRVMRSVDTTDGLAGRVIRPWATAEAERPRLARHGGARPDGQPRVLRRGGARLAAGRPRR